MRSTFVGAQSGEYLIWEHLKVILNLLELFWEVLVIQELLLLHLAQVLAKLLCNIKDILNSLEHFSVIQETLLDDLLQVLFVHIAHLLEVRAVLEAFLQLDPNCL